MLNYIIILLKETNNTIKVTKERKNERKKVLTLLRKIKTFSPSIILKTHLVEALPHNLCNGTLLFLLLLNLHLHSGHFLSLCKRQASLCLQLCLPCKEINLFLPNIRFRVWRPSPCWLWSWSLCKSFVNA